VDGEAIASHVKHALDSDADVIVAGGGDGTISSVVRGIIGGRRSLGVLPLGTLNHFAKDMGIPLELHDAIRTVVTGVSTSIDIAEVNGVAFVNNSSVGVYAALVRGREALQKQSGRGKVYAMLAVGLRMLWKFPMLDVDLDADGESISRRTPLVFIGNNEYQISLFEQGARARLDGGRLCLYIAQCDGRWAAVRLLVRFILGRPEQARDFELWKVKEVRIKSHKHHLHVAIDGEVFRLTPPLRYVIHPMALQVIVPPASSNA